MAIRQLVYLLVYALIAIAVWAYYQSGKPAPYRRYLTFGPRFWAGLVDACVVWPVSFIAVLILASEVPRGLAAFAVVIQSLAWLLYTVIMHARRGQTVGKMVTKVRVVDNRTEGSISWWQAWLREGIPMLLSLGWIVWQVVHLLDWSWTYGTSARLDAELSSRIVWVLSSLPMLWFAAEVITMLTNKKRRALHDFIAGTVVVRTNTVAVEISSESGSEHDSEISGWARRTQGWAREDDAIIGPGEEGR